MRVFGTLGLNPREKWAEWIWQAMISYHIWPYAKTRLFIHCFYASFSFFYRFGNHLSHISFSSCLLICISSFIQSGRYWLLINNLTYYILLFNTEIRSKSNLFVPCLSLRSFFLYCYLYHQQTIYLLRCRNKWTNMFGRQKVNMGWVDALCGRPKFDSNIHSHLKLDYITILFRNVRSVNKVILGR